MAAKKPTGNKGSSSAKEPVRTSSTIGKVVELQLDSLSIGKSQVRVDASKGIRELAQSIAKVGLLEPIVVTHIGDNKYEILTGQRRFLAHEILKYKTIQAIVVDRKVSQAEAKVISLTENLLREDLTQKEKIDACTSLFKTYGSFKIVAEQTGLSQVLVKEYVKYESLAPKLKQMVDDGKVDVRAALQAQRAAESTDGEVDETAAVKFAKELVPMSGVQRKQFIKAAESDPEATPEEKIEKGRKQPELKQILVTLEAGLHHKLQKFAKNEGVSQDEAASSLIEKALDVL
ncbi:MAG: ParB/RepB/Spo0J family partition protein [Planctomycetota bacterium]